jgi:nucleoside-triphosphatase THEP1
MRILLEGRPGAGKSTVARHLADRLRKEGIAVNGFVTEEIRESGRRLGFSLERLGGERGVLAHVDLPGPPRSSTGRCASWQRSKAHRTHSRTPSSADTTSRPCT